MPEEFKYTFFIIILQWKLDYILNIILVELCLCMNSRPSFCEINTV